MVLSHRTSVATTASKTAIIGDVACSCPTIALSVFLANTSRIAHTTNISIPKIWKMVIFWLKKKYANIARYSEARENSAVITPWLIPLNSQYWNEYSTRTPAIKVIRASRLTAIIADQFIASPSSFRNFEFLQS